MRHFKNCDPEIKNLTLKFSHNQFNWSQEVLIISLKHSGYADNFDLERKKIDVILIDENLRAEHKFVGLLTKSITKLETIIKSVQSKIKRKKLNLLIISTLTSKRIEIEEFLFNIDICLHVIIIDGETMASATAKDLASNTIQIVESSFDVNEEQITPINAKILVIMEAQQNRLEIKTKELKNENIELRKELKADNAELKADNIELRKELKADNAELKADNAELKADNAELKADNAELRKELKADNTELKADNAELKADNIELKRMLQLLLERSIN